MQAWPCAVAWVSSIVSAMGEAGLDPGSVGHVIPDVTVGILRLIVRDHDTEHQVRLPTSGMSARTTQPPSSPTLSAHWRSTAPPDTPRGSWRLPPRSCRARARSTTRARRLLVTGELALSVVFMVGAGLLIQTFGNLRAVDPGFEPEGVVTFDLSLVSRERYRGPADRSAFVRLLQARLQALPGVRAVGVVGGAPLSGETFTQPWGRPGEPHRLRLGMFWVLRNGRRGRRRRAGAGFSLADAWQSPRIACRIPRG